MGVGLRALGLGIPAAAIIAQHPRGRTPLPRSSFDPITDDRRAD